MRERLVGILAAATLASFLVPGMAETSQREPGYFARSASIQTLDAAPVDRAGGSGLLMLVGFLGLIAGLLTHWSRDTSCREARSVHRSDEAA